MTDAAAARAPDLALRRRVLVGAGALDDEVAELLAYNRGPALSSAGPALAGFPLADEPHLEAWRRYSDEASHRGAWPVLRERLPQLRFPVATAMSADPAYRQATRQGVWNRDAGPETGLGLRDPEGLELHLHATAGGTVPLLVVADRADFVALVQAFCHRNEPRPVPASMGACIVSGYNNWDRIAAHRRAWEAANPATNEEAWRQEFVRLQGHKSLYQDRFVVLSRGPYSNVASRDAGFAAETWDEHSLAIRREHECTHYLVLRVFGTLENNILEELVADFAGLTASLGAFRGDLARLFLGVESLPHVRADGRLHNYRGNPPLSDGAFRVLARLVDAAVESLSRIATLRPEVLPAADRRARVVCGLTSLTLEELVADGLPARLDGRLAALFGSST